MNVTKISINDIEEFLILTDDIVDILRYRKAFYDDEGNQRYFKTSQEYQNAMKHKTNFIVERFYIKVRKTIFQKTLKRAAESFRTLLSVKKRKWLFILRNRCNAISSTTSV